MCVRVTDRKVNVVISKVMILERETSHCVRCKWMVRTMNWLKVSVYLGESLGKKGSGNQSSLKRENGRCCEDHIPVIVKYWCRLNVNDIKRDGFAEKC